MRDIRGDLQDRATLLEGEINAQESQFDRLYEQLKQEHETRLEELKAELEAVNRLMELERRRLEASAAGQRPLVHEAASQAVHEPHQHVQPQPQPQPLHQHVQPQPQPQPPAPRQPQQPLADFLIRKLNEAGAMSRDDLRRFALQEGYFVDAETADRGVHATLINVVKAGLIRQLPNGNFAPATVLDTIRLRRAM
jgi:hypothetical protein